MEAADGGPAVGDNDIPDVDLDEHDDDWIIDDLGGGMQDKAEKDLDFGSGGLREMGKE